MQQLAVALSKEHTEIQNFGNVKQKVVVDNFSKHGGGEEVFLQEVEGLRIFFVMIYYSILHFTSAKVR